MARTVSQAALSGLIITTVSFILFFAVPNKNTYLAAPGVVIAFLANGGVHGDGLGSHFVSLFWATAIGINWITYSLVSWICLVLWKRARVIRVSS